MSRIKVEIDELMDKLNEIKDNDYTTVELLIATDDYDTELCLSAVSFEEDEPINFGSIAELDEELM